MQWEYQRNRNTASPRAGAFQSSFIATANLTFRRSHYQTCSQNEKMPISLCSSFSSSSPAPTPHPSTYWLYMLESASKVCLPCATILKPGLICLPAEIDLFEHAMDQIEAHVTRRLLILYARQPNEDLVAYSKSHDRLDCRGDTINRFPIRRQACFAVQTRLDFVRAPRFVLVYLS